MNETQEQQLLVNIRPGGQADTDFLFATWLRCYKRSSYFARKITPGVFFAHHHRVIERILARASFTVASPAGDDATIIGYLVSERRDRPVIHFAYTKWAFQRLGVMRKLLAAADIADLSLATFTHWTYDADSLVAKWPGISYDPYLGME